MLICYNNMENNKIIPQAEDVLEHSLMMQIPLPTQPKFTPTTLKAMAKDVDKLISRLPYHRTQLKSQPIVEADNNNPVGQAPNKFKDLAIGKYNPLGQVYRYQQAEFQLQISKPQLKQEAKSQKNIQVHKPKQPEFSLRDKDSVMAEESLDNSQIKFPTHNYYIMFNKKRKQKEAPPKVSRTICLQKKVQKLQKQVKMLRGQKTATTNFYKSDGKMKLDKLLDSIIG